MINFIRLRKSRKSNFSGVVKSTSGPGQLTTFPLRMSALVFIVILPIAVVSATEKDVCADHLPGHEYSFYELEEPRPLRVHTMTVDLAESKVEPVVVIAEDSPEEDRNAVRTNPRRLAEHPLLLSFVNTNPWSPWSPDYPVNVNIIGLAAMGGIVRSPADQGRVSVWADDRGRIHIGYPDENEVREGVGGFQQIIRDGKVIVNQGGPAHPRTALGVDKEGRRLCIMVVEGRNPGVSEGVTIHELALLMEKKFGCRDAANMDGGGSCVLGIVDTEGEMRILDGEPGRYLRPLPIILTIRRKAE